MSKKLKDITLQEITLRKYEEPISTEPNELIRKFCLSVGLLQPGDSRDIVVDVFSELLKSRRSGQLLTIPHLLNTLERPGSSASNIRRQLRRLRELKLVEKLPQGYRITEFGKLEPIISTYIEQFVVQPSLNRIKQYAQELDNLE